jgi:hypothetical protein
MATKKQMEQAMDDMVALVKAAQMAERVLRELHQSDEALEVAEALEPFETILHECPENPHLGCGECGGDPVCECAPGQCPED